jgi:hypothetical protein
MNRSYEHSPRFDVAGLATGSILALIVAMAISAAFNIQPADPSTGTTVAHNVYSHA